MQTQPDQPPSPRRELLSIAQLAVSGLGMGFSLLSAGGLAILGLVGLFSETVQVSEVTALFATAWISLLIAVLAVPSLVYSIQRLWNRAPALPRADGLRLSSILLLVWPLVLLLGNLIAGRSSLSWLVLPPLGLLAVGLPIWWLIEFARRRIPVGSRQRGWGLVSFSMFITTPALLFVEILVMIVLVIIFAFWVSTQPQLVLMLQQLMERLTIGQPDPQAILETLLPYLQSPAVLIGALAITAGLVPLIEELLKPLAMWFLVGRKLTPAQGFAAGAVCGGMFALLESLFYLTNPVGENWAALAAGRATTGLLHVTTTALIGWALASAWQGGSYVRLGAVYLLSSALHGLWNALSVLTGFSAVLDGAPANMELVARLGKIAPIGLGVLVLLLFLLLWWGNRTASQAQPPLQPEPAVGV